MRRSLLYNPSALTALEGQSCIKPRSERSSRGLYATLLLTPLVDAFSILVIYLMVSTTSSVDIDINQDIQLPEASYSSVIESGTLVQLSGKDFLIDEQKIGASDLLDYLTRLHETLKKASDPKAKKLIVQADRSENFETLNPLVMAGTQSGFEEIVFAVIQTSEARGQD